ncbi:MAG: hypothetical protein C3F02_03345 [Parcubacteria group bacterium]|nr:MAG: hypothetical protein C3F02_03345 [Parcubacteria group bacterium]
MPKEKKEIKFDQPSEILIVANRFTWLLILVIVLGVLTAGYFLFIAPSLADINGQRSVTAESEFVRGKHQELLQRLKELKTEYTTIKTTRTDILDRLKSAVPDDPQTAELFVLSEKLALDRGFILESIELVDKPNKDKAAVATGQTAPVSTQGLPPALVAEIGQTAPSGSSAILTMSTSTPALDTMIIHLNLSRPAKEESEEGTPLLPAEGTESDYDLFKKYLSDLESNLRLMDIQSVAFGEFGGKEPNTFGVNLVTYYK